jgi:putative glutamine amidotransferase
MTPPLIGITRDSDGTPGPTDSHYSFYRDSVAKAGGQPREIFYTADLTGIPALLDELDGLLLSGGDDLDPALYHQPWHPKAHKIDPRRQAFELELLRQAEARRLPILGICLGCQLMNVHRRGSLIQFLPEVSRPSALEHRKINGVLLRHDVALTANSLLARTTGKATLNVNTYHKQAIDRIGQRLNATARATDGVIEAVEDPTLPLFVGVQWHPERISDEPDQLAIFKLLVKAAS